jgi:two-component system sensor histidine kinase KdpD
MSETVRRELAEMISDQASRLNQLIGNLLDMTRLESGALRVRKEWHVFEDVVGAALVRLEGTLGGRPVVLSLPENLPLVPLDDVLFEQVVRNLIENADRYSPAGSTIELSAAADGAALRFEVADRGPGFAPGEEARVFERFYRGSAGAGRPGAGLGLAICNGIVEAHGGTIRAENRPGGGAVFRVRVPIEGVAPAVERETSAEPASGSAR